MLGNPGIVEGAPRSGVTHPPWPDTQRPTKGAAKLCQEPCYVRGNQRLPAIVPRCSITIQSRTSSASFLSFQGQIRLMNQNAFAAFNLSGRGNLHFRIFGPWTIPTAKEIAAPKCRHPPSCTLPFLGETFNKDLHRNNSFAKNVREEPTTVIWSL